jgi:hypothetical protein
VSFLTDLVESIGESAVTGMLLNVLEAQVKGAASAAGVAAFERIVTIPEKDLEAICQKTGADYTAVEAQMRTAAAAYGELLTLLANVQPSA